MDLTLYVIGETAGKIYQALEAKNELSLKELQKVIKTKDAALVNQALGWLAREDKVRFKTEKKETLISLSAPVAAY